MSWGLRAIIAELRLEIERLKAEVARLQKALDKPG